MLGDPAVGKTSMVHRFVFETFGDKYLSTIGAKITKKVVNVETKEGEAEVTLLIWDIAGQKTFGSIHPTYYRGAEGAFVVCDVTRRETLESLPKWTETFFDVAGRVPVMFIANKNDLPNKTFTESELAEVSKWFGAKHYFSSAKTGENIERVFYEISKALVEEMR